MRRTYYAVAVLATLAACLAPAHAENPLARDFSSSALPAMALTLGASGLSPNGKNHKALLNGVEAVAATSLLTEVLKSTVREPRPNGSNRASFPSGHTSAAFAMATVLADEQPKLKWFWYLLAAGVGWSRVDLRAHHTHDVIAGAVLGTFVARQIINRNGSGAPGLGVALFQKTW